MSVVLVVLTVPRLACSTLSGKEAIELRRLLTRRSCRYMWWVLPGMGWHTRLIGKRPLRAFHDQNFGSTETSNVQSQH